MTDYGKCVTHHICDCKHEELERLKGISQHIRYVDWENAKLEYETRKGIERGEAEIDAGKGLSFEEAFGLEDREGEG